MDFQDQGGVITDSLGIILQVSFVGRSNLDQFRARRLENFGDAEAPSNLNQFSAADDDLVPIGGDEGSKGKDESRSTIVKGIRGLSFEKNVKSSFELTSALSPLSVQEVEFEIGITGRHFTERFCSPLSHRGPPKVSVNDNSSRIDHRLEPRRPKILKCRSRSLFDGLPVGGFSLGEAFPPVREAAFDKTCDQGAGKTALRGEVRGEFLHGGQLAEVRHGTKKVQAYWSRHSLQSSWSSPVTRNSRWGCEISVAPHWAQW